MNEIIIDDSEGNELAVWLDADLRLRLPARDLLDALHELLSANGGDP